MTEWHIRYRVRDVMIYWHVAKHSTCIYSQLKSCSSSEVASVLQHCLGMVVEENYVDSHGQSEVAFVFFHLLSFQLMPRLKVKHPTYQVLSELGKVIKAIFSCDHLGSEDIRREINEGLNVIEN